MTTTATTTAGITGGSWLLEETAPGSIFTPERLNDEHRLIDQTAEAFVTKEVMPNHDQLETKDWDLARRLVSRAGDLGLMGTDVPEAYGGVELDKAASVVVGSRLGQSGSFGSTFGAQTGLAIMPLQCFGTDTQKAKYLGKLVSGEWVGAYCLSESGSGSDALSAKTHATQHADGSCVLNGEKMWITNGGFADLFVVFAKVDGEQFTAFLVERGYPGVSTGNEEHKMGLHGSSTTPVILQDVRVPAENVFGEVGRGHKVAFNTLNYGRFKLAVAASGGATYAIGEAARYAAERHQFGRPIASFGAIKHKLGEMAVRAYAVDSMIFRTTGLFDAALADHDPADAGPLRDILEELAVECAILKVAGSEMIQYVLDENVQIHGRQRVRQGLPGRTPLSGRPGEPHLRGHERDQPTPHSGHADPPRAQGRSAARRRRDRAAGRDHEPAGPDRVVRRTAGRAAAGRVGLQEDSADGARSGDATLRREAERRAGGPVVDGRHPHRHFCSRECRPARAAGGHRGAEHRRAADQRPPVSM